MASRDGELMLGTSPIYRNLDAKFKIGGVEAQDLILVLISGAMMNLFFGQLSIGPLFIFGVPTVLFLSLYFGKRGKPEGHLIHLFKFYISSGEIQAGEKERTF